MTEESIPTTEEPIATVRLVAVYAFLAFVVFLALVQAYFSADKQTREDYASCQKEGLIIASNDFQNCLARYRTIRFEQAKAADAQRAAAGEKK